MIHRMGYSNLFGETYSTPFKFSVSINASLSVGSPPGVICSDRGVSFHDHQVLRKYGDIQRLETELEPVRSGHNRASKDNEQNR
jgi:hypothetical protein